MPELPEVETVARGLQSRLRGQQIRGFELVRPSVFRGPNPEALVQGRIEAVQRAGKYLVLEIGGADARRWQLMFHLGMTGRLVVYLEGKAPERHTHVIVKVDGGEVHFRDPRRFGRVALAAAPVAGGWAPELGIAAGAEPLEIESEAFVALFRGRKAPIKSALLNQKLLRGVGNIYADESLYRAGISPRARSLSGPRLRRLRLALRAVLKEAIAAGGSSFSDYRDSSGQPGWFQLQHRVYGREGEPCRRCGTAIRRMVLGGRSAHYCPGCQKR